MDITRRGFVGGVFGGLVCPTLLLPKQKVIEEKEPIRTDLPEWFEIHIDSIMPPPSIPIEEIMFNSVHVKYSDRSFCYKITSIEWCDNPEGLNQVYMYDDHFTFWGCGIKVLGHANGRTYEEKLFLLKLYFEKEYDGV